ncbi:hypothetical protein FOL47_008804 [Perkinsus chesapeaki]|uniref:Uncharacterized protein n=1 Tax=Perkinsus chesapeaki TaxID=330153 RepID=A0A7J6LBY0_PERCH|nr:hypothetical protein FOL47_008804 [Perkinsus chesapeaki]
MSGSANFVTQVQLPGSARSLPLVTQWHIARDGDNHRESDVIYFDCIVVDKLMRQAWTGSVSQRDLSQSLSWGNDSLLRLKEIVTFGEGIELARSGEGLLLSVTSQLPVGKLTLLKDVELKLSNDMAVQKLIECALSQYRSTEASFDYITSDERDVDRFCSEADRMLTQLRQRNTDLREQCVTSLVSLPVGDGQLIELDAVLGGIPGYESVFYPYCHLKELGLWASVDTGGALFQLVWREWYDSVMGPYSCANLFAGCYVCKPPCDPRHAVTRVETFLDGSRVKIFEHEGDLKIGSVDVRKMKFQLIFGQDPPPSVSPVFNLLGLGRQPEGGFPPLLYQLIDKNPKVIHSRAFAIYFDEKAPNRYLFWQGPIGWW